MRRTGLWKSLALPLVLALTLPVAAAPPADKSALAQVPASSLLVVHLHGVEGSAGRFLVYLKNALPDVAPIVDGAITQFLKEGGDGRKLRGLAKEGPIFFAMSEIPKGDNPIGVGIIAVTDYKAFRDGLLKDEERKNLRVDPKGYEESTLDGKPIFFVDRQGYAIVTNDKKTALAYTKKQVGLDTKISKDQSAQLLSSDLGWYVNMDVVNKEYADKLKTAKEDIEEAIKNLEGALGKSERGAFEALRRGIGPVFQAIEDSKGALLTLEFRPTALVLHVESESRPNTTTAKLLKPFKPVAMAEVDRLPAGQAFYTGIATNAELLKVFGPLAIGATAEPGSKSAAAMEAALEQLAKAGPGTRIDVTGLPLLGLETWQFSEPAKALAAQMMVLDSLAKGDTFANGMLKKKTALKKGAAKYKNVEFSSLTLVWDLEKMAAASGMELPDEIKKKMTEGMKRILGEETTIWIGADDKQLFTITAPDWKSAEALLDRHARGDDAIGKQKGYQEARKEMPAEATIVGMVDMVAYGAAIAEIVKPMFVGLGLNLPEKYPAKLPKGDPSFLGVGVTLNEKRIAFDLVITSSAVRDVYKAFIQPLRAAF